MRDSTIRARALLTENLSWVGDGWRATLKPLLISLWTTAFNWFVYLLTLLAAYALARHALPFHRALRAQAIRWPAPANVRRRLGHLLRAGQPLLERFRQLIWPDIISLETPEVEPTQSHWRDVWRAELRVAARWWRALSASARRNLARVIVTDAAFGLLFLRLLGML